MKSFRQFIIEAPENPNLDLRLLQSRIEKRQGRPLSAKEKEQLRKWATTEVKNKGIGSELSPNVKRTIETQAATEKLGGYDDGKPTSVRGSDSIKDREKKKRFFDQEKLDQRKLAAQERTKFKKTTKAERAKHIGKPTHISKKHGVKYIPPKDVPKSELTGPNTKGEIVSRRRAKRSIDIGRKPEKISDVKKKIDNIDAFNRRHKKAEYSTSTQAKNRYGGKSVQDSRGRWVPDPVDDGKPIKEPGKSAGRRTPSKSVEQLKKEIESRTDGRKSNKPPKSTTTKGNKPLGKPSPVPGGTTPSKPTPVDFQTKPSIPKDFKPRGSSTSKLSSSYNKKGDANLRKLLDRSKGKNNVLKGGGTPQVENPWKDTDYIDPPKKTEVIDQRKVSKKAADFTKDTNTERIKKLSRRRVKIDYSMPEPKKGEILRSVDKRPKVKTQLSPDTIRSTNPQSNINTTYDKSKASKAFKDMASDSKKKLSIIGRSKKGVKDLTNKVKNVLGFKSKVKSTLTPKTKIPKNKLFQRLNITRKKGLRTFKGTGPGAFYGLDAYTRQRDAGAGIKRSTGGAVTSAATSGLIWKGVSGLLNKYAPAKGLGGKLINIGLSGAAAWKVGDETLKAYDATLGPTKGKNPPQKKVAAPLVPFGGSKKKKKLDFKNYTFSLSGDARKNTKDKK